MKTKSILILAVFLIFNSCSKESSSGNKIYYVLKATYDNPQDHGGVVNAELTNVALTMPSGSNSVSGNLSTPHTTAEREYTSGMTVTATGESVLTHVTVTIEIWKNGVKWKFLTVPGSNSYTVVTVTGTV
jgi:hypothetical protein